MVALVQNNPGQEVNQKTADQLELKGSSGPEGDTSSVFEARNRRALNEVNRLLAEFQPEPNAKTAITATGSEVTQIFGNNIHENAERAGQDVYDRTRSRAQAMGVNGDAAIETAWRAKQIAEHSARADGSSLEVKDSKEVMGPEISNTQNQGLTPEQQLALKRGFEADRAAITEAMGVRSPRAAFQDPQAQPGQERLQERLAVSPRKDIETKERIFNIVNLMPKPESPTKTI